MFASGETVGLAEWIIDDTCLVFSFFQSIWTYTEALLGKLCFETDCTRKKITIKNYKINVW